MNDDGDANIIDLTISPEKGRQGTTFYTDFYYASENGTGTSEVLLVILGPDLIPFNVTRLVEGRDPGKYFETISFTTEPDPECDPTARKRLLRIPFESYCFACTFPRYRIMRTMAARIVQRYNLPV